MLSTNSTSGIDKRRQLHRRQQSLEVPIVAPPLPANTRRTKRPNAHQRGLSLDQSLSALNSSAVTLHSPIGFRPLLPQEHDHHQGPTPPVRIQLDTTNIVHSPDQQHYIKQETQLHRPAQPGYPAQDFSSHLQQQLNGNVHAPAIFSPQPTHPHQQAALQELQHHLEWYQQNFGGHSQSHSPSPSASANMTGFNFNPSDQPLSDHMAANPVDMGSRIANTMPHTPVSHGHVHSHTVPNTPQHYVQHWPSPPPTNAKHARSQSFQLDVAPMPISPAVGHIMGAGTPNNAHHGFSQDSFDFGSDPIYSSSNVDPMSPGRQQHFGTMPTLFEESTHGGLTDDALLLQVTASDDFNSPNFVVGGSLEGLSPDSAMLAGLGDGVNCSIVDTGITEEQIDACISEQDPESKSWYCLFEVNGQPCNNPSKRRENQRSHVQSHLGDRRFMCNDCGKTFVRPHDMKRHAAIHSDDRPHVCPCEQSFARADALTRHRQRGMCKGTLPGFEKTEEEKPKRGRPKKQRPDDETRTSKATKARKMDRTNAAEADAALLEAATMAGAMSFNYASSSSAISDFSLPMTPPNDDFDPDAFLNLANADYTASSSWRDTPPTSPVGAHPGVAHHMDIFSDALTPESDHSGSSPLTCGGAPPEMEMFSHDWSKFAYDQDKGLVDLEAWIQTH